jgi:FixJ family two-component response regulator
MDELSPKVFIVDDDDSIRRGLERLMKSVGLESASFPSAQDFLDNDPYPGPGCLVLDVRMPGLSGLDLQDELTKRELDVPIIFITGHGDVPMSVRAMKAGAIDFLQKPFNDQDLIDAVNHAIDKDRERLKTHAELVDIRALIDTLTPREYEVFTWVITGRLNKQIADELGTSEKTVKVHRGRVMQKLEVESVAELVRLAEKAGVTPPSG